MANAPPFWRTKTLPEMSRAEWESLCDGCGRCCVVKLEDIDTGRYFFTDVACRLFDPKTCRCSDYAHRFRKVKDCVKLTPQTAKSLGWLPTTCAYRTLAEGRPLAWWHPLVSGDSATVHEAGISMRRRTVSESKVKDEDLEDHIIGLPKALPQKRRKSPVK
jgi:uncharacterized protein